MTRGTATYYEAHDGHCTQAGRYTPGQGFAMRHRLVTAAVAVLVPWGLLPLSAVPAGAEGTGTPCVAEWDITISPGLTLAPSHGTYGTKGENGTVTCEGTVNGAAATGPGTWGTSGTYEEPGDCLSGRGAITFTFTIPTARGDHRGRTTGVYDYGLRYGQPPLGGSMTTPRASGTFSATPSQGDCVLAPFTAAHIRFDLLLVD